MKFKDIPFIDIIETIIDNRGRTCPVQEKGIPLIATNCIKDNTLYPAFEKVRYVSQETYNTWFRGHPQPNDIIFVLKGSPGRVNWVPNPINFCIAQDMVAIRANEKIVDSKYLFALLKSKLVRQKIENMHVGSLIPHFKKGDFNKLILPIPDNIEYQKKVGQIYFDFSLKIELNRKMNETLETMAQALFKSWFVDFDPVHVKANAKSEQELEVAAAKLGISKEILDLFPSEFEESEMGMIPLGWEVKPFGELLSKTIGGDWGKEEPDAKHTEKVKIIRGTDIPKIKNISIEAVPTRYVEAKKLKTRELFDGDIVIEVSGGTKNQPTGRTLYITNEVLNMLGGKVEPASFCRLFRPINAEIGLILGQHMLHIYDQGKTWQYQNQSTGISNFQTTIFLEKENIIVPDTKVLNEFYKIVRPLIEKSLSSENITLQKTRDILLTKLLSGELDVPEVEQEKVI